MRHGKRNGKRGNLRGSENTIFRNTFADIRMIAEQLGTNEYQIKFEHECYDVGHLYT